MRKFKYEIYILLSFLVYLGVTRQYELQGNIIHKGINYNAILITRQYQLQTKWIARWYELLGNINHKGISITREYK